MLTLEKFSIGVGDRFAHQAKAQLRACQQIAAQGVEGVVDYATANFLGVRSGDALYRFFGRNAFGGPVGMSIHHFGDGVDAEAAGAEWTRWLAGVYA